MQNKGKKERIMMAVFFIVVMMLWYLSIPFFKVSPLIFPGPQQVLSALYEGLVTGEFYLHFGVTLYEIVAGFLIGSLAGFVLGAAIAQIRILEVLLYPYVVAFQTTPKVAIAPLFIVWFGFDTLSKVVITSTIVFFPVLTNTIVGLRSAPGDQLEMMQAFTANRWQLFKMVRLPNALPYVFAGLDIGIVLAVIGAIVGEFVGAQSGLGYLILQKNFSMDTPGVFAILIILSMIGLALHWTMKIISRKVVFWAEVSPNGSVKNG